MLNREGYPKVANLDAGFSLWKTKGMPWESNMSYGCGCCCNNSDSGEGGSCC